MRLPITLTNANFGSLLSIQVGLTAICSKGSFELIWTGVIVELRIAAGWRV